MPWPSWQTLETAVRYNSSGVNLARWNRLERGPENEIRLCRQKAQKLCIVL